MNNKMVFQYDAKVEDFVAVNDAFDSAKIRVCYPGANRNKSFISKEAIEEAAATLPYCPVVTNYDIEADEFGGHDMAVVDRDGGLALVNLTDAVGVIPQEPEWFWETVEDGGVTHEYFCVKALIWKRSAAYHKLKADGVTAQSMEISIDAWHKDEEDGLSHIDKFSFNALALIGVTPAFEGASITFSAKDLSEKCSAMLEDFKLAFSKVIPASADDNNSNPKGGEEPMNIEELLARFGLSAEDVDFATDGLTEAELEEKFAELAKAKKPEDDPEDDPEDKDEPEDKQDENEGEDDSEDDEDDQDKDEPEKKFELNSNLEGELRKALCKVTYKTRWHDEFQKYWYLDCDVEAGLVYAEDCENCAVVGIPFSMDGDNVKLDLDGAVRKKLAYVDFDEGSMDGMNEALDSIRGWYDSKFEAMTGELDELRTFKQDTLNAQAEEAAGEVFSAFADLDGNEAFEALKADHAGMDKTALEEKCFAIRGRAVVVKFSAEQNGPIRVPASHHENVDDANEPYGGLFKKYN